MVTFKKYIPGVATLVVASFVGATDGAVFAIHSKMNIVQFP